MSSDKMLARKKGAVGHMVFNNPERHNAVSMEMWQAAESILADFNEDANIRVIVLSGAGGKAFVSGADISKFEDERSSAEAVKRYGETTARAYSNLYSSPKPTIAMVQGGAYAGGFLLAQMCDLVVTEDNAKFAITEARWGRGAPWAAPLPWLIPPRVATTSRPRIPTVTVCPIPSIRIRSAGTPTATACRTSTRTTTATG